MVEDKKNRFKKGKWLMKCHVPVRDSLLLEDWETECSKPTPIGFGNYYWGKILHDHLFTKTFKNELVLLKEELKQLSIKLDKLGEKNEDKSKDSKA